MSLANNNDSEKNNYSFIKREEILSNSKFKVFFDHLVSKDGCEVKDFIVVKPKISNSKNIVGICVLPLLNEKFYLMKGWRHQFNDYIFQAPTGFIEKNESSAQTALRELSEELSLTCKPDDLINLGTFLPDAGLIEGKVELFLAMNCIKEDKVSISEIGTGIALPLSNKEIFELIVTESNIGGSTIVAILRAFSYLKTLKHEF